MDRVLLPPSSDRRRRSCGGHCFSLFSFTRLLNHPLKHALAHLLSPTQPILPQVLAGGAGILDLGLVAGAIGSHHTHKGLVGVVRLDTRLESDGNSVALVDDDGGGRHGSVPFVASLG